MKRITLLIFLIAASSQCYSQVYYVLERDVVAKKTIGSYDYAITYKYSFAKDTISKNRYYDMYRLEIGKSFSRYYSLYADKCDSIMYKARIDKNNKRDGIRTSAWMHGGQQANYEDFYLNYPQNGELLCRTAIINTEYEYSEPMNNFKWTLIQDSTANILGYNCKIAETSFRGRKYRVYFSTEIPISSGPWKFYGLPGLILKVKELSGLFEWDAVGISKAQGNIYIFDSKKRATPNIPYMHIKKITRMQLRKMQKMIWDDPIGLSEEHGQIMTGIIDIKTHKRRPFTKEDKEEFRSPYIPPLELD
ncbi:MAG: GLPGLI family protein [Bacteroidales bacterium]|jgi:GLPGLI family protein|nr:GLPGLI family protein [Bacteroidales bacterium]